MAILESLVETAGQQGLVSLDQDPTSDNKSDLILRVRTPGGGYEQRVKAGWPTLILIGILPEEVDGFCGKVGRNYSGGFNVITCLDNEAIAREVMRPGIIQQVAGSSAVAVCIFGRNGYVVIGADGKPEVVWQQDIQDIARVMRELLDVSGLTGPTNLFMESGGDMFPEVEPGEGAARATGENHHAFDVGEFFATAAMEIPRDGEPIRLGIKPDENTGFAE